MNQKLTKPTKLKQIEKEWLLLDAKGQILGRLSSHIASLLLGKGKSYYSPNLDCGDFVIVVNAKEIKVTGRKEDDKKYFRYSGYPSGLKETNLARLRETKPEEIIRKAVWGMLPKGRLGREMVKKLFIYSGAEHLQEAQKPRKVEL